MDKEVIDKAIEFIKSSQCKYDGWDKLFEICRYIYNLEQQCKKQKEVIDDCEEDISNLLDIINKNCNELKCTSDEWLVIQKYQDKEVSE